MILTFRPLKVRPPEWKPVHARRPKAPFDGSYQRTLDDLDRELRHLEGRDPFLQVDVTDAELRLDGALRAGAHPNHPGVLLTFETKKLGTLVYGTDVYDHWHGNLRGIALGLDALRRVERYGIGQRGQQYAGYRELPAGIEVGRAMTPEEAAEILVEFGEWGGERANPADLIGDPAVVAAYYRSAARRHHPDAGGDPERFRRITQARDVLEAAR